jgi:hypothetical protein
MIMRHGPLQISKCLHKERLVVVFFATPPEINRLEEKGLQGMGGHALVRFGDVLFGNVGESVLVAVRPRRVPAPVEVTTVFGEQRVDVHARVDDRAAQSELTMPNDVVFVLVTSDDTLAPCSSQVFVADRESEAGQVGTSFQIKDCFCSYLYRN